MSEQSTIDVLEIGEAKLRETATAMTGFYKLLMQGCGDEAKTHTTTHVDIKKLPIAPTEE